MRFFLETAHETKKITSFLTKNALFNKPQTMLLLDRLVLPGGARPLAATSY